MTDTPGANTTHISTEILSLRQPSEEPERDNHVLFPAAPDTLAEAGENPPCSCPTAPCVLF